jgi:hypothetical protein
MKPTQSELNESHLKHVEAREQRCKELILIWEEEKKLKKESKKKKK